MYQGPSVNFTCAVDGSLNNAVTAAYDQCVQQLVIPFDEFLLNASLPAAYGGVKEDASGSTYALAAAAANVILPTDNAIHCSGTAPSITCTEPAHGSACIVTGTNNDQCVRVPWTVQLAAGNYSAPYPGLHSRGAIDFEGVAMNGPFGTDMTTITLTGSSGSYGSFLSMPPASALNGVALNANGDTLRNILFKSAVSPDTNNQQIVNIDVSTLPKLSEYQNFTYQGISGNGFQGVAMRFVAGPQNCNNIIQHGVLDNGDLYRGTGSDYLVAEEGCIENMTVFRGHYDSQGAQFCDGTSPRGANTSASFYVGAVYDETYTVNISSYSASTNGDGTVTVTAAYTSPTPFGSGASIGPLSGFTQTWGSTYLNGQKVTVLAAGFSSTSMEFVVTAASGVSLTTDAGSGTLAATQNPISNRILFAEVNGGANPIVIGGADDFEWGGNHTEACVGVTNGPKYQAGGSGARNIKFDRGELINVGIQNFAVTSVGAPSGGFSTYSGTVPTSLVGGTTNYIAFRSCTNTANNGYYKVNGNFASGSVSVANPNAVAGSETCIAHTGYDFDTTQGGTAAITDLSDPPASLAADSYILAAPGFTQVFRMGTTPNVGNSNGTQMFTYGVTSTTAAAAGVGNVLQLPGPVTETSVSGSGPIVGIASSAVAEQQPFWLKFTGTPTLVTTSTSQAATSATTYSSVSVGANNLVTLNIPNQIPNPGASGITTSVTNNGTTATYNGATNAFVNAVNLGITPTQIIATGCTNPGNDGQFNIIGSFNAIAVTVNNGSAVTGSDTCTLYFNFAEMAKAASFGGSCVPLNTATNVASLQLIATTTSSITVLTSALSGSGTCGTNGGTMTLVTNLYLEGLASITVRAGEMLSFRWNDITQAYDCSGCKAAGGSQTGPTEARTLTSAGGPSAVSTSGVNQTLPDTFTGQCGQNGPATGVLDSTTELPLMRGEQLCAETGSNYGASLWLSPNVIDVPGSNTLAPVSGSPWVEAQYWFYNGGSPYTTVPAIEIGSSGKITGVQGTDSNLLSAGTVSGTASPLCTDANGGATTSGCPSQAAQSVTFAALTNAGTGATTPACASGYTCNNQTGYATFTAGSGSATGAMVSITWSTALSSKPACTLASSSSNSIMASMEQSTSATTTTSVTLNSNALTNGSTYGFIYNCPNP